MLEYVVVNLEVMRNRGTLLKLSYHSLSLLDHLTDTQEGGVGGLLGNWVWTNQDEFSCCGESPTREAGQKGSD